MDKLQHVAEFLLANPLILIPLLLAAAVVVYAVLKRFFKVAAVLVIAAVLYVLLMEHFGPGLGGSTGATGIGL